MDGGHRVAHRDELRPQPEGGVRERRPVPLARRPGDGLGGGGQAVEGQLAEGRGPDAAPEGRGEPHARDLGHEVDERVGHVAPQRVPPALPGGLAEAGEGGHPVQRLAVDRLQPADRVLVRERGQEQPAEVAPVGLGRQEAVEQALERLAPEGGLAREARLAEQLERVRVAQGRAQRPGDPLLPLRVAVEDVQEVAQARDRGRARRGRGLGALEAVRAPHPAGEGPEPAQPRLEGLGGVGAGERGRRGRSSPWRTLATSAGPTAPRGAQSLDPPAAQADLAVVEDDGLARRDRPLRRVEAHLGTAAAQ